ncbi:MAG: hypothetical protein MJ252_25765 [archaeon]|nr:hypothetical protein [archaeon]
MDPKFLRSSHWNVGEDSKFAPNHFDTTYNLTMQPKQLPNTAPAPNANFISSLYFAAPSAPNFDTEHRSNYVPLQNKIDPKDIEQMKGVVADIKKSHFVFGESPDDYNSINSTSYKYDPDAAQKARGALDKELIKDLRATHYRLGNSDFVGTTTHQDSYVPLDIGYKAADDPLLRRSHFVFGDEKEQIHQDDKTIYQTDYVPKPIPKEEDYFY